MADAKRLSVGSIVFRQHYDGTKPPITFVVERNDGERVLLRERDMPQNRRVSVRIVNIGTKTLTGSKTYYTD